MKLLIIGINFAPELTGTGRYTGELAYWLAEHGHQVRVVTAPPYYPHWRIQESYSAWRYRKELLKGGIEIWRCPLWVPERPSGGKRLLHLLSFGISSLPPALLASRWRPDWVFLVIPTFFSFPSALLTAWLGRARLWLHLQDFEIDAALRLGLLGRFPKLQSLERGLLSCGDVVSTISHTMRERLIREKGVVPERTFLLPNWADPTLRFDPEAGRAFRRRLGLREDTPVVLYAGNIGVKQGLEILPRIAASLPHVQFLICGEGAYKESLKRLCSGHTNIHFLPLQPPETFAGLLSAADVHLVLQRRGAADLVLPSKLTNILVVGGRAVVTADPETELGLLAREHPGVVELVPPEDPEALSSALSRVLLEVRQQGRFNERAFVYAQYHLNRERILEAFEKQLLMTRT